MLMPNCSMNLTGFTISNDSQVLIQKIMRKLHSLSPSDGRIGLDLSRGESDVNGILFLKSTHLTFESTIIGIDAVQVVTQLGEELQVQLKLWSSRKRFQNS